MADNDRSQGINSHKVINAPVPRKHRCARNHKSRARNTEDEGEFETLHKSRHFFEKGGVFDFLGGSAPRHVDFEEVAEKRLGDVHRYSAQEDGEEEEPFEVFEDWVVLVWVCKIWVG